MPTLYLIGLGLGDEKDITVKGLEAVKKCKAVYLEHYTAILGCGKERLEAFYGVPVILADRECVENSEICGKTILADAQKHDTAFLVVGDPLAATTHTDLMLRAAALPNVTCNVIHNTSIFTAVASTGLQLYQFGQTVSIPFFSATWRPDSFYEKIRTNLHAKFHTLCLLDIKVKEQTNENLAKGIRLYEPPRFMSIPTAIEQLLEVEDKYKLKLYNRDTLVVGVARLGQADQKVVSGTMGELLDARNVDWGGPLHSLVIPGECHFIEADMLEFHHWNKAARAKAKAEAEAKQRATAKADAKADREQRDARRKADDELRVAKAAAEKERLRKAAAEALKNSAKAAAAPAAAAAGAGAGAGVAAAGAGAGAGGAAGAGTPAAAEPDVGEVPSLF